jgi:hypothetical protein
LALYERYELLELRRDDGIQTFHARDRETARPVQIHLFPENPPENTAAEDRKLLSRIEYLPDAERRRIIERADYNGRPYVITDRLAGYPGFREWLTMKTDPAARHASLDDQFHQLFDPYAETAALTAFSSPIAAPMAPISHVTKESQPELTPEEPARTQPGIRVVGKSLIGILLGIAAAILLLGLIVAGLAFLPR